MSERISRKDIAKLSTLEFMKVAWEPYRKLFAYLKPYKSRFILGMIFGALYGVTGGALIFTVRHVSAIVFPKPGEHNASLEWLQGALGGEISPVVLVAISCGLVPLVMILRGLFSYLNAYYLLWVSLRVLDDIRTQLFGHILSQSLEFFNRAKGGELIQTVFNQTRMAQQALTSIAGDIIKQPISIIGALGALLFIDWKFTLVAFVLFPACILPAVIVGRKVRKAGAKEEEEAGAIMVVMHEAFAGIRVVKAHGREENEKEKFDAAGRKMLAFIMRWRKAMELVGPLVEALASIGVCLSLLYVWYFKLGADQFLSLVGGLLLLYPPIKALSKIHILMQKCLSATTKVFEMMEREPAVKDAPDAVTLESCRGEIRFEDVTFRYNPNAEPAVRNLHLVMEPGKSYALVGESGAGKSTILSLLLRFYDPEKGQVLLDGKDIRSISLASLREQIGVVTQETFLFHDTILKNIQYGRLDATREETEEAAKRAFAHDFILSQEHGYDTVIGDKGCNLSGGQQQRLTIARAILRNAPILLLDEATSALDAESEKKIQQALALLAEKKTTIAIAHRLSTVLKSDQIIVMEKTDDGGRVADIGTHAELLGRSPLYRRLYELQFHGEREEVPALVGA